jgi:hypothetical protein
MVCGASAICLDLMSARIFGMIRKILVVPVCHRRTPVIGYFSESCLLAIIGLPWPMTKSANSSRNSCLSCYPTHSNIKIVPSLNKNFPCFFFPADGIPLCVEPLPAVPVTVAVDVAIAITASVVSFAAALS